MTRYPWIAASIFAIWLAGASVIIVREDAAVEYLFGFVLTTTVLLVAVGFRSIK